MIVYGAPCCCQPLGDPLVLLAFYATFSSFAVIQTEVDLECLQWRLFPIWVQSCIQLSASRLTLTLEGQTVVPRIVVVILGYLRSIDIEMKARARGGGMRIRVVLIRFPTILVPLNQHEVILIFISNASSFPSSFDLQRYLEFQSIERLQIGFHWDSDYISQKIDNLQGYFSGLWTVDSGG